MLTIVLFAFLSGIVTVASPCVLPVLPFLLSGAIGGRLRPYGIITGFILSFTVFTLTLSAILAALHIPPDATRLISVALLLAFGLTLLIPALHTVYERFSTQSVSRLNTGGQISSSPDSGNGFVGGVMVGGTLGLLWTPCVGPIMSAVITLALSGNVTFQAFLVTLAFSIGTAIPMLAVMLGGRGALARVPWLMNNLGTVQRGFGAVMVVFAIGIFFNVDRKVQTWFLDTFPAYSDTLTKFEENAPVKALEVPAPKTP
jgi:cytochrome c-type biogenesis protein